MSSEMVGACVAKASRAATATSTMIASAPRTGTRRHQTHAAASP